MAKKKYVKDYELHEHFDEKGHVHSTYRYRADFYEFVLPPAEVLRSALKTLPVLAVGIIGYLAATLMPMTVLMHRFYVSLPMVLCAIPLVRLSSLMIMTAGKAREVMRTKAGMEHRHADKLENSYPAGCALQILFSMIALIGSVIVLCTERPVTGGNWNYRDTIVCISIAAELFCGIRMMQLRGNFRTRACEHTEKN